MYCETCCQVICRDCTFSKEHNTHNFCLITECYPKHHQQIQDSLDLVKHKLADVNTAVTNLATRESEVLQQGQQLKDQVNTHAQQIIDQVQRSQTQLLQQVDTIVQQKTQVLTAQKQQAQKLHTQLETCQEMIERSLKEWNQQQILTEKHSILDLMNTATDHADAAVFQPIESVDMQFVKTIVAESEIGLITSTTYDTNKSSLKPLSVRPKKLSNAVITLQSRNGSPFSLPTSLISCTLSSPGDNHSAIKCNVTTLTGKQGKYNITFTPSTRHDHLIVHVGGVCIPDSPFIVPSPEMRRKPVNIITGLKRPRGIAVCANGDIVVAEYDAHCVTILNKKGKKIKSFGSLGTKNGQFTNPCGVAVSYDGHILVTDNHRLQKLTTDGVCVKSVGSSNSGSGRLEFCCPAGIAVHPTTGQIYVADSNNNRIQVFTNDLIILPTIIPPGKKRFKCPCDVALDNEGFLYVAEWEDHCITTRQHRGITQIGSIGSASGQLSCPSSLAIESNLVYVSEYGNNRVSIFDTNGKFHHCFAGTGEKEVELKSPFGIAIDTYGDLYVCDTYSNRIIIF